VESNRVFALFFYEIFNEPSANPWVDGFEKVRNLGSREFDVLRLKDLCAWKDGVGVIPRTGQLVERTSKAIF